MSLASPDLSASAYSDGRRLRSYKTRQKIVSAAMALPGEGVLRPSMDQISQRAGISLRTVFQHFKKGQLTRATLEALLRREHFDPPLAALLKRDALEARIAAFVDQRVSKLEYLTPYRKAANAAIDGSPILQKHRLKVRKGYRDDVAAWFAPELDMFKEPHRQRWLMALANLADWEMWHSLRTYPDRSIGEAKSALSLLLLATLKALEGEAATAVRK
jgi:TetR/AcrR family transcriptional regulator, regulator of autoinduction and epiphytic fitness